MLQTRIIPVLLLKNRGLVKTVNFKNPTYVGDPINAVKVFNDKEADELIFLDIMASPQSGGPDEKKIKEITNECFMPLCYGGGVASVEQMKRIFGFGIEKISLNTAACENPSIISEAARVFGSQSVVVSIDAKKNIFGKYEIMYRSGRKKMNKSVAQWAREVQELGAGEILINSIDRDGTMKGYDIDLIRQISPVAKVPLVACGGAGSVADLDAAIKAGASAAAAGSLFVFYGKNRAVLINYPLVNRSV